MPAAAPWILVIPSPNLSPPPPSGSLVINRFFPLLSLWVNRPDTVLQLEQNEQRIVSGLRSSAEGMSHAAEGLSHLKNRPKIESQVLAVSSKHQKVSRDSRCYQSRCIPHGELHLRPKNAVGSIKG